MNIKIFNALLLILFAHIIFFSCAENKSKEMTWNLIVKDGLLYSDSLATEPFTGRYKGKVVGKDIEYDVVNGKRHGIFAIYHTNGNLEVFGEMANEKNIGVWKYYYPNGVLESSGKYVDDKPDSVWNWYYMTTTTKQIGEFNEGIKTGEWKYYDDFGNLYLVMKFNNGVLTDSVAYELPIVNKDSAVQDTSGK